jgi:hypothetical protein
MVARVSWFSGSPFFMEFVSNCLTFLVAGGFPHLEHVGNPGDLAGLDNVGVNLGGFDVGVAKKLLDQAEVAAGLKNVRGEAVTQLVRGEAVEPGAFASPPA